TSLWLSRSASRIEDEDQLNGSYSQNPDKELVLRVHKDDVIPINPIIQAEDSKEELLDDLSITSQPPAEDNGEQDFSVEIDGNIVDNNVDVVDVDEPETLFVVDQEEDVPSSSKEQPLDDIDENNHDKEHNSSSTSSEKSILKIEDASTDVGIHSPPSQSHEVLSPQRDTPPILNLEDEEESSNESSDEDQCPQPSAGKTSALKQLPSFFPPSLDLIRSMRALQAITTEQKHNLMKQRSTPTNDDEGRTPPPSKETSPTSRVTRRKLVKPPSFTNEQ
uniref:Uncharacterized protein n=1 Tax=Ciona savignyi TaxID=51511 RepID=H2YRC6_CIOSA